MYLQPRKCFADPQAKIDVLGLTVSAGGSNFFHRVVGHTSGKQIDAEVREQLLHSTGRRIYQHSQGSYAKCFDTFFS